MGAKLKHDMLRLLVDGGFVRALLNQAQHPVMCIPAAAHIVLEHKRCASE